MFVIAGTKTIGSYRLPPELRQRITSFWTVEDCFGAERFARKYNTREAAEAENIPHYYLAIRHLNIEEVEDL